MRCSSLDEPQPPPPFCRTRCVTRSCCGLENRSFGSSSPLPRIYFWCCCASGLCLSVIYFSSGCSFATCSSVLICSSATLICFCATWTCSGATCSGATCSAAALCWCRRCFEPRASGFCEDSGACNYFESSIRFYEAPDYGHLLAAQLVLYFSRQ